MFPRSFVLIGLAAALGACGGGSGSGSVANGTAPAFRPGVPAAQASASISFAAARSLVEDFPLAANVRYPAAVTPIERAASLDFERGSLRVMEDGGRAGAIDVGQELLYGTLDPHFPPGTLDVDQEGDEQWFVTGSGTLLARNADTGNTRSFSLGDGIEFSEVAATEGVVWLYERRNHRIHRFDMATHAASQVQLEGELKSVTGLSAEGDLLWLLGAAQPAQMVVSLRVEEGSRLVQAGAWRIHDPVFTDFNDMVRTPTDRWVVSRAGAGPQLFVLDDKERYAGPGPIADTGRLAVAATRPLPAGIAQPSGLYPRKDGTWLLVTDQGELRTMSADLGTVLSDVRVRYDSIDCVQGCTEAVVVPTDDDAYAVSDTGTVAHYRRDASGAYVKASEFRLPLPQGTPVGGIAHDPVANRFYVVNDSESGILQDTLYVMDGKFTLLETHALRHDGASGNINHYRANGLVYKDGALFMVSSTFTKLLKLSPTGSILGAYEFDEVAEPTDLAWRDGLWWVTGDHEDGAPLPPVIGFRMPG